MLRTLSSSGFGLRTVSRWFVDRGVCYAIGVSLPDYDVGARSNYFNQLVGGFQPRADT